MSFALWYRLTSAAPGGGAGYQLLAKDNVGQRSYTVDINPGSSDGVRFYTNGGLGSGGDFVSGGGTGIQAAGAEAWVHGAFKSGTFIGVYVNGVDVGSTTSVGSAINSTSSNVLIGAREYSGFEEYLDGVIGYLALWNRRLLPGEIVEHHRNPWQLFARAQRPVYVSAQTAAFIPAWARGANSTVSTGARAH